VVGSTASSTTVSTTDTTATVGSGNGDGRLKNMATDDEVSWHALGGDGQGTEPGQVAPDGGVVGKSSGDVDSPEPNSVVGGTTGSGSTGVPGSGEAPNRVVDSPEPNSVVGGTTGSGSTGVPGSGEAPNRAVDSPAN